MKLFSLKTFAIYGSYMYGNLYLLHTQWFQKMQLSYRANSISIDADMAEILQGQPVRWINGQMAVQLYIVDWCMHYSCNYAEYIVIQLNHSYL